MLLVFPSDSEHHRLWIAGKDGNLTNTAMSALPILLVARRPMITCLLIIFLAFLKHMSSPLKKKKSDLNTFNRRKQANRTRLENVLQQEARQEQARKEKSAKEEAVREKAAKEDAARYGALVSGVECSWSNSQSIATQTELLVMDI